MWRKEKPFSPHLQTPDAGTYDLSVRPHPRIRKTVKWGGAVVTVLLVIAWVGTGWAGAAWGSGRGLVLMVARGQVVIECIHVGTAASWFGQWQSGTYPREHRLWFEWYFSRGSWALSVPLWVPIALVAPSAALAWRLDMLARRRERSQRNLCLKCGYDRAGLAAGAVCPECGRSGA